MILADFSWQKLFIMICLESKTELISPRKSLEHKSKFFIILQGLVVVHWINQINRVAT